MSSVARFSNGVIDFQINEVPMRRMLGWAQHSPTALEAGGVLLGRELRDGSAVVVDDITRPMDGDIQSRRAFFRGAEAHQAAIDHAWNQSNGTCIYLGEWHTHAEADPTPSEVDVADWSKHMVDTVNPPWLFFFVIVGTSVVRVFFGDTRRRTIEHLPFLPTDAASEPAKAVH